MIMYHLIRYCISWYNTHDTVPIMMILFWLLSGSFLHRQIFNTQKLHPVLFALRNSRTHPPPRYRLFLIWCCMMWNNPVSFNIVSYHMVGLEIFLNGLEYKKNLFVILLLKNTKKTKFEKCSHVFLLVNYHKVKRHANNTTYSALYCQKQWKINKSWSKYCYNKFKLQKDIPAE